MNLLRLALTVAVVLGIIVASNFSDLSSASESSIDQTRTLRDVSAIIFLVVVAGAGVVGVLGHMRSHLPIRATAVLIAFDGLLVRLLNIAQKRRASDQVIQTIASLYKVVLYEASSPNPLHAGTKVAFWICSAVPEALATALLFSVNLVTEFDLVNGRKKAKFEKACKKAAKNGAPMPIWEEEGDAELQKSASSPWSLAQNHTYPPESAPPYPHAPSKQNV